MIHTFSQQPEISTTSDGIHPEKGLQNELTIEELVKILGFEATEIRSHLDNFKEGIDYKKHPNGFFPPKYSFTPKGAKKILEIKNSRENPLSNNSKKTTAGVNSLLSNYSSQSGIGKLRLGEYDEKTRWSMKFGEYWDDAMEENPGWFRGANLDLSCIIKFKNFILEKEGKEPITEEQDKQQAIEKAKIPSMSQTEVIAACEDPRGLREYWILAAESNPEWFAQKETDTSHRRLLSKYLEDFEAGLRLRHSRAGFHKPISTKKA